MRHNDALAGGEAVSLDDDRHALAADVMQRRLEFREVLVGTRRDVVARKEVLGESLGALELRSGGTRAEAGQVFIEEAIDDAGDERRLGPDDREPYLLLLREFDETVDVVGRYRRVTDFLLACGTSVAGRDDDLVGRLRALPREGVLATAGSYY